MLTRKLKQRRSEELETIKSRILNNIPHLNKRQIRRHRIPYYEAIIQELQEDQFEETANFLKGLIDYQNEAYRLAGDEAILTIKPLLKEDKAMLDILYDGLKAAETGIKNNQKGLEVQKLLALAIYFSNQINGWWWIAEQLFNQAVNSAKQYYDDEHKKQAMACFMFGKFLFKQIKDYKRAEHNLIICRDLSSGKKWTITKHHLRVHHTSLYDECCTLLCEIYMYMSKKKIYTDPNTAVKLSTVALKNAQNAGKLDFEADCIFLQGQCEEALGRPDQALAKFKKALILYISLNNKYGICETRIQLALTNNKMDQFSEAKYHLHHLYEYTEKHNLMYYFAICHRYLGEFHLIRNLGEIASNYLIKALKIFQELNDDYNTGNVTNLAAIATGTHLSNLFMKMINSCDKGKPNHIQNYTKLLLWKQRRLEFWNDSTDELNYLKQYMTIYGECQKCDSSNDISTTTVSSSSNIH